MESVEKSKVNQKSTQSKSKMEPRTWLDNGVPYQLCDHICEPYHFKNEMTKWPTCSSDIDGFCNSVELTGMVQVGSMTYFQDHKWYDELADGRLKEETLLHKAKVKESWGNATPGTMRRILGFRIRCIDPCTVDLAIGKLTIWYTLKKTCVELVRSILKPRQYTLFAQELKLENHPEQHIRRYVVLNLHNTPYCLEEQDTLFRLQQSICCLDRRFDAPYPTGGYAVSGGLPE
nr:hypothetical protein [Tanacetum cinerariifolium]